MAYLALYRKYRPRTFSSVMGQDHITTILKNQIREGRTAHAYLFCGSRGTGKTSVAKILAKAANCLDPQDGEPCLKCSACMIEDTVNADIIELDAASNNGVDDMRSIIEKAKYIPIQLARKVYIIDEAHMLSTNAFNALLKTLEEPPEHIIFMLATTEVNKIPATIVSRCQRYDFHRLRVEEIINCMKTVLRDAGAEIDEEGLRAIALSADGGMRDALSIADQCISFCGGKVAYKDVISVLGGMDDSVMFSMADSIIEGQSGSAMRIIDQVIKQGRDVTVFSQDLIQHLRALLLAKTCGDCTGILECTQDAMNRYIEQAGRATEAQLLRALELLGRMLSNLKWLSLPRIAVESTVVRLTRPEEERDIDSLLARLEKIEKDIAEGGIKTPRQKPAEYSAPEIDRTETAPAAEQPKEAEPEKEEIRTGEDRAKDVWKRLLESQKHKNLALYTCLFNAGSVWLEGNRLNAGLVKPAFYTALTIPENFRLLQLALQEIDDSLEINVVKLNDKNDSLNRAKQLFGDDLEIID